MNGKDIFMGLKYVGEDLIEEAEYGHFPLRETSPAKKTPKLRRSLLVAAVIAMMLLLVGCAVVYVLRMQEIRIGEQQTYRDIFAYDPDTGAAVEYLGQETVTEQVLTLAGMKGSPNYLAAQEWFAFKQEYDPDYSIIMELQKVGAVPEFPEEYESYNIYSREMKDKLDEILKKYNLKLIGRTIPFRTEELTCKALGLENIVAAGSNAAMELDYAGYQECGNLNMDFDLILPDGENTRCHIFYMRKDAFTEDVISLEEIESWKEWNYTTASGADVLIFCSPSDWWGYVFCNMPNYTVTLRFTFIDEQYSNDIAGNMIVDKEIMTERQIEQLADAVDFSFEPRLIDGWEDLANQTMDSGEEIEGYSVELKSVKSDGNNAFITLGITAPEGVNLTEHNEYPILLKHSNRWGFFEPVSNISGNVSGGYYSEDDGDGKTNTQNAVLEYSADAEHMRDGEIPFSAGKVWNIYWQDLHASYLDEGTNEVVQYPLVNGTWSFDVVFEDVITEELEMITKPVLSRASYGWDLQGNDVYQETMITSFILRPMSATIICDLEDVAPDFLTEGDRCIYVVLKDGNRIALHGDNGGSGIQNLQPESQIDLNLVAYVVLCDGTKLLVP